MWAKFILQSLNLVIVWRLKERHFNYDFANIELGQPGCYLRHGFTLHISNGIFALDLEKSKTIRSGESQSPQMDMLIQIF